jgi:hypothetical protein
MVFTSSTQKGNDAQRRQILGSRCTSLEAGLPNSAMATGREIQRIKGATTRPTKLGSLKSKNIFKISKLS